MIDHQLLARAKRQEPEAVTAIFNTYHRDLKPIAYGLAPGAWEDVLQDAYVKAFDGFPRFRGEPGSVLGWLVTIVRRLAYDSYRPARREALGVTTDEPGAPDDYELGVALGAALRGLSAPLCEAVLLVDYLGLTYDEAAVVANTKPGTVASRLHTARSQLRAILSDSGGDGRE